MTLLRCLKTPALKILTLGFEYFEGSSNISDISPFLSFVSQSSFHLHTLTLSLVPATADAPIECLKVTPSVVHVNIDASHRILEMDRVSMKLTGNRDFLPKLKILHTALSSRASGPISSWIVVDMLDRRCGGVEVARLQSFRLAHAYDKSAFEDGIKSHHVYHQLKTSGTVLYVGERSYKDLFM